MKYKLIAGIILLVPVLMFVQQNIEVVTIRFFRWEQSLSLALLLLLSLMSGVVLGLLLSYFRKRKKNKKLKKAQREQQQPVPNEPVVEPDLEKTVVLDSSTSGPDDQQHRES
ncbi:MAG: DUF1049 domain-containing protein [Desulfuromonadales bacterium]|nr:DUF1049 domain-containing protein [Desulfuromonadales bacterium]MBN2793320.1 DUF1049 domain-containing protein [Desulfuromonadales bacterium]